MQEISPETLREVSHIRNMLADVSSARSASIKRFVSEMRKQTTITPEHVKRMLEKLESLNSALDEHVATVMAMSEILREALDGKNN